MSIKFDKKSLKEQIEKSLEKIDLERAARFVVNNIKDNTRKGKSVVTGTDFKKLSPYTIEKRKKLALTNRTHPKYRENFSNITFTGQVVNALTFSVYQTKGLAKIRVFTKNNIRKPYKLYVGKESKLKTNLEVQQEIEKTRPYIGLDKQGEKDLKIIIANEIEKEIRKIKG